MPKSHKEVRRFLLTVDSNNHKTGHMPVSTSPMQTCPETCPFRGRGCYSNYGPALVWWRACTRAKGETAAEYRAFLGRVRNEIPEGQVWRHNQAGDLVSANNVHIDPAAALQLVAASQHTKGFTYTHYGVVEQKGTPADAATHNLRVVETMNRMGFAVNISCNSLAHADRVKDTGTSAPVTVMVPEQVMKDGTKVMQTPKGRKVVVCPNVTKGIQCVNCNLCMKTERDAIIAFPCHGSGKKRAEEVLAEWATGDDVPVEHERKGTYKVRYTYHAGRDGEKPLQPPRPKKLSGKAKRIAELEQALKEALDHISERDYDHYCEHSTGHQTAEDLERHSIVGDLRKILNGDK